MARERGATHCINPAQSRDVAAEIREIADFYNMPVGRKLARLQPEIMADIMPKISDTINDRVLKAMQREGLTIRSVSSNQ